MELGFCIRGTGLGNKSTGVTTSPVPLPQRRHQAASPQQPRLAASTSGVQSALRQRVPIPSQRAVKSPGNLPLQSAPATASQSSPQKTAHAPTALNPSPPVVAATAAPPPQLAPELVAAEQASPPQQPKLLLPPEADSSCIIRYNHYKESFQFKAGRLSSEAIVDKYCFSYVFKGSYRLHLSTFPDKNQPESLPVEEEILTLTDTATADDPVSGASAGDGGADGNVAAVRRVTTIFKGLQPGQQYVVEIKEDQEELEAADAARSSPKPLDALELTRLRMAAQHHLASSPSAAGTISSIPSSKPSITSNGSSIDRIVQQSREFSNITKALKSTDAGEIRKGSDRMRELLEARDVEDILFSK